MKEEIISIETLTKLNELEKQKKDALEYINKKCVYDEHLQGFCMGLSAGEIKTLVLKLGGNKDEKI